ncbi:hypothetical protein [Rufibacter sp. LB8]|uniref:hypothetical protein n=1 Tax=Rufibacter sp. LB8 TaxID=2777781 RepID=UPI00178C2E21|nr:hypothetical protein [Rufibacter sp. LB8]
MPIRTYTIPNTDPAQILTLRWGFNWKNMVLTIDGEEIGSIATAKELREGRSFQLAEGKELFVQLKQDGISHSLELLLNGNPLPGSGSDPHQQLKTAVAVLYFIGAFNILLGILSELVQIELLKTLGLGITSAVIGAFYLGLGYFIQKRLSIGAIYLAIGLLVLDIFFSFYMSTEIGGNPVTGLFIKILFITMLYNGIKAIKKIKGEEILLQNQN